MKKIFYSWQSDLRSHKTYLQRCLEQAARSVGGYEVETATRNTQGAVDISASILKKIEESDMFLADISIVNPGAEERLMPNPNVMYELGYAVAKKGEGPIILVANTESTDLADLPFDVRNRRIVARRFNSKNEAALIAELQQIIEGHTPLPDAPSGPYISLQYTGHSNEYIQFTATNDESKRYNLEAIELGGIEDIITRSLTPGSETAGVQSRILPRPPFEKELNTIKFVVSRLDKSFRIHQRLILGDRADQKFNLTQIDPNPILIESIPKWRQQAKSEVLSPNGADAARVQFEDRETHNKFIVNISHTLLSMWPGANREETLQYFIRLGNAINRKLEGKSDGEYKFTTYDGITDFEDAIDKVYRGELVE
jgi:hypothetical protein